MIVSIGESVGQGHPDKICDQVADLILDTALSFDPHARVACEVLFSDSSLLVTGEVQVNKEVVVQFKTNSKQKINYFLQKIFFHEKINVEIKLHQPSTELTKTIGANDQCVVTGYACTETDAMLPLAQVIANTIIAQLTNFDSEILYDMKAIVVIKRRSHQSKNIVQGAVSFLQKKRWSDSVFHQNCQNIFNQIINPIISTYHLHSTLDNWIINGNGQWTQGYSRADTGLTGRKLMVDCYGPNVVHGGGSFSGKDMRKMDRAGAYYCRFLARHVIVAKLAEKCQITLGFRINEENPFLISVNIFNNQNSAILTKKIQAIISDPQQTAFNFYVENIIKNMSLPKNHYYQALAFGGHFGRKDLNNLPWEVIHPELIEQLKML